MAKSLADLLAETESILDVRESREQLRSGRLQQEDVEEMAPHTPWRDFLTETLLDPSQYLTGGVMGAGFAAKLGRPALATALQWADPLMGGSKALGRMFEGAPGKWPVGARMGGFTRPRPSGPMMGAEAATAPRPEFPQLIEGGLPRELPAVSPQDVLRTGARTMADILPMGVRKAPITLGETPRGLLTEGRPQLLLPSGHGELSEDVVNLSNSFTRQFRQPIDELVEAADKMVSRNRLVREAEKILGKTREGLGETVPTIKLKDGTIIKGEPGQQHFGIADDYGISYDNVVETAFIDSTGKYVKPREAKPTIPQKKGKFIQGDPRESITLYHTTTKPLSIMKEGIKPSEAGVIKKEGKSYVYAATSKDKALMSFDYENELRQRVKGAEPSKGDVFVVKVTVPKSDVTVKPNGDVVLSRTITPDEISDITTRSGKLYFNKEGKFTQGSPTEVNPLNLQAGDFVEFTTLDGQIVRGKIRDVDEYANEALVFTPKDRLIGATVPLDKVRLVQTGQDRVERELAREQLIKGKFTQGSPTRIKELPRGGMGPKERERMMERIKEKLKREKESKEEPSLGSKTPKHKEFDGDEERGIRLRAQLEGITVEEAKKRYLRK